MPTAKSHTTKAAARTSAPTRTSAPATSASTAHEHASSAHTYHDEGATSHLALARTASGLNRPVPGDKDLVELPLSEDEMFRGLIFAVNRLHVRLPSQELQDRDVIRHPGAVAVVALTDDGNIVLVRQWRSALGRITLEIPAGKLEAGEDAERAAARELLEETGVVPKKLEHLTSIAPAPGYSDELIHLYMATQLEFRSAQPDEDEFVHMELVPLSRLIDEVLDGRIEDAKTIIAALVCDAVSHRLSPHASAPKEGE